MAAIWSRILAPARRRESRVNAGPRRDRRQPRFVVTTYLTVKEVDARTRYERVYCARGDIEWFDRLTMRPAQAMPAHTFRRFARPAAPPSAAAPRR
jgi:hypothetical protein